MADPFCFGAYSVNFL